MKEIKKLEEHPEGKEDYNFYCTPFYYDPLLDYVYTLAKKCAPVTPYDIECGYVEPKAPGIFVNRYFQKEIDKSPLHEFLEKSNGVFESIKLLGYDVDKFWYLTLFIYDFSHGYCHKGLKLTETPREQMVELISRITENIEFFNQTDVVPKFKEPMELSLKIQGKRKFTINDPDTIFLFAWLSLEKLNDIGKNSRLDKSQTTIVDNSESFNYFPLSNSIHIWYFANLFKTFFELLPPNEGRNGGNSEISYNKMWLVSKLIYIMGINRNENFLSGKKTLQGYLSRVDSQILDKMFNIIYA